MGRERGNERLRQRARRISLLLATGLVGFGMALAAVALARSQRPAPGAEPPAPLAAFEPAPGPAPAFASGRAAPAAGADPGLEAVGPQAPDPAPPADAPSAPSGSAEEPAPEIVHRIDPDGRLTASGVIHRGGSLTRSLLARGLPPTAVYTITHQMEGVFDFRNAHAGDRWQLVHDADDGVVEFQYATADLASYHLWRSDGEYHAEKRVPRTVRTTARIAGVVTTSLYDAIRDLGESGQLASDFAELFAWDVDFSRSVQPGDRFAILYERLYRERPDGQREYTGPGLILAARYEGQTGDHSVVYFESGESHGGYYRDDGSSVERQFLVAPVKYSRISSRFTSSRHHPILKINRPHYGIDYAAPVGTPIFAVADGQVVYRGWASGYGNLVKVRHTNGYISYYAHMSRFADTVRLGDWVHQKQVIGYVGSTGLSTGPHVCFRVRKDGRFVNPANLRTPAGDPVPRDRMREFALVRDALFAQLDGNTLVATDEAL